MVKGQSEPTRGMSAMYKFGARVNVGAERRRYRAIFEQLHRFYSSLGRCSDNLIFGQETFFCTLWSAHADTIKKDRSPGFDCAGSLHGYDYDLVVIGGGSGGLACSKEGEYTQVLCACDGKGRHTNRFHLNKALVYHTYSNGMYDPI